MMVLGEREAKEQEREEVISGGGGELLREVAFPGRPAPGGRHHGGDGLGLLCGR